MNKAKDHGLTNDWKPLRDLPLELICYETMVCNFQAEMKIATLNERGTGNLHFFRLPQKEQQRNGTA